ncbi:MAG: ribosomal L7Ae/L30e/S12e/Gadd45 family protein [Candidatus Aenigmarchaeota archaeon]|nr:ribosomal L7Ae/L30e/S12e/Gadd45 family protein [Candidatus Aenigmarchaeota archaeon]OYT58334.1 MAG: hypothetical protein B6U68_00060 [Candidatus Aenigmarchaeota archaeon ex4484_14]
MVIKTLPEKEFQIGTREILKGIKEKKIDFVVLANNTPKQIVEKIKNSGVKYEIFDGDGGKLGTAIGKPFPVTAVGFRA